MLERLGRRANARIAAESRRGRPNRVKQRLVLHDPAAKDEPLRRQHQHCIRRELAEVVADDCEGCVAFRQSSSDSVASDDRGAAGKSLETVAVEQADTREVDVSERRATRV